SCSTIEITRSKEARMAVAYLQGFEVVDGATSTATYDAVLAQLGLDDAPDGLVVHSAGFDHEKGVLRIFDVWESRQAGEQWMETVLNPVLAQVMSQPREPDSLTPPTADYWYELHDSVS